MIEMFMKQRILVFTLVLHFTYLTMCYFLLSLMMLRDRSEFFLWLKSCFIVYMNSNQNKSKSMFFSECKPILKLHDSLLITYYCFSTIN